MAAKDSIVNSDVEQGVHLAEMVADSPAAAAAAAIAIGSSSSSSSLSSSSLPDSSSIMDDQITPLLSQSEKPKINIFSVSYPRRKPLPERITRLAETEKSTLMQFVLWAWSGSRYSGLLCMALSSIIYCTMEVISDFFTAQSVPLFEIAFTRCTVISILSFVWLRKSAHPIFGPTSARNLLISRAIMGYISLASFIYCIQNLPRSQAILLSFSSPIMASVAARFILHEKLKIAEIGGLACSFFGILFIFQTMRSTQEGVAKAGEESDAYVQGSNHIFAFVVGLISSIAAGISYCLVRAGAKAADQPLLTVFSFAMLASPAAAVCTFAFQEFVVPGFYTLFLMVVLGILAFLAEITLARALQLEKTSKVTNIQYLEAALFQLLGMGSSRVVPSFGRVVGCSLILISACCTMYVGPEKTMIEIDQATPNE